MPWLPTRTCDVPTIVRIPLILPVHGVSFSGFNRFITPKNERVLYDMYGSKKYGMVFAYEDGVTDRSISPRCFYTRDAHSVFRGDGGCSSCFGVQLQRPVLNPNGYAIENASSDWEDKLYENVFRRGRNLFEQVLLDFKGFVNKLMDVNEVPDKRFGRWNEIVFPNWNWSDKEIKVPLVAFFAEAGNDEALRLVKECRLSFEATTGYKVPIVSFDVDSPGKVFSVVTSTSFIN